MWNKLKLWLNDHARAIGTCAIAGTTALVLGDNVFAADTPTTLADVFGADGLGTMITDAAAALGDVIKAVAPVILVGAAAIFAVRFIMKIFHVAK
ncbi:hypothetical protein AGMMS49959_15300 [Planctomycetales bacterium]|nr:hypothetical protein AGMMS49959_15300 [Planctomycetales bacterium]